MFRFALGGNSWSTAPRVTMRLFEDFGNGNQGEVIQLWHSDELHGMEVKDIMKKGYTELPTVHAPNLGISTDRDWGIEIRIDNNGRFIHIFPELRLELYYVP